MVIWFFLTLLSQISFIASASASHKNMPAAIYLFFCIHTCAFQPCLCLVSISTTFYYFPLIVLYTYFIFPNVSSSFPSLLLASTNTLQGCFFFCMLFSYNPSIFHRQQLVSILFFKRYSMETGPSTHQIHADH